MPEPQFVEVFEWETEMSEVEDTGNLYLETSGDRVLTLWRIKNMDAFIRWFKKNYPTPPSLRKITLHGEAK